jgi:hypothetical protein
VPLTRYARLLAVEEAAVTRARIRKRERREDPMIELTILQDEVTFKDVGPIQVANRGDVVLVQRDSVIRSLVVSGLAVEGRVSSFDAEGPASPDPSPMSATSPSSAGEVITVSVSWSDVDGISQSSMELLLANAKDANLRQVTRDQLLAWLGGSTRRTDLVWKALEKAREGWATAAEGTGDGGDA